MCIVVLLHPFRVSNIYVNFIYSVVSQSLYLEKELLSFLYLYTVIQSKEIQNPAPFSRGADSIANLAASTVLHLRTLPRHCRWRKACTANGNLPDHVDQYEAKKKESVHAVNIIKLTGSINWKKFVYFNGASKEPPKKPGATLFLFVFHSTVPVHLLQKPNS
jgi:hypothetical protein